MKLFVWWLVVTAARDDGSSRVVSLGEPMATLIVFIDETPRIQYVARVERSTGKEGFSDLLALKRITQFARQYGPLTDVGLEHLKTKLVERVNENPFLSAKERAELAATIERTDLSDEIVFEYTASALSRSGLLPSVPSGASGGVPGSPLLRVYKDPPYPLPRLVPPRS